MDFLLQRRQFSERRARTDELLATLRQRRKRLTPAGKSRLALSVTTGAYAVAFDQFATIDLAVETGEPTTDFTLNEVIALAVTTRKPKYVVNVDQDIDLTVTSGAYAITFGITGPVLPLEIESGAYAVVVTVDPGSIDITATSGPYEVEFTQNDATVTLYSVYALDIQTGAAAEYTNFELELMEVNGAMIAVGTGGLYTLGADDDDGTDIDAVLRTGFDDFESDSLKRFDSVRLAGSGRLCVKVRAVSKNDALKEFMYEPDSLISTSPNARIVKTGKGLRFTYAAVELLNMDGGDFEIDQLDYYPVVLERRS